MGSEDVDSESDSDDSEAGEDIPWGQGTEGSSEIGQDAASGEFD